MQMDGSMVLRPKRPRNPVGLAIPWILSAGAWVWFYFTIQRAIHQLSTDTAIVLVISATVGLVSLGVALFLHWGVYEFRPKYHHLTVRTGLGPAMHVRELIDPTLHLEYRVDSDGDEHYTLVARSESNKRTIASSMNEIRSPLLVGRWLANKISTDLEIAPEIKPSLVA